MQSVFAQNCVAVVFLVAVVANLVMPREKQGEEESVGSAFPDNERASLVDANVGSGSKREMPDALIDEDAVASGA